MIVAMVQDFDLAEELFQETVVEVLKSEDKFDPSRSFVPWACGVAKNVVQRHWRNQKRIPANGVNEMLVELASIAVEGDDEVWRGERIALRRCFQKLTPHMQRLLILRYGQNVKGKALASQASIRVGSIRTTLSRLRCQLRQCIHSQTMQFDEGVRRDGS